MFKDVLQVLLYGILIYGCCITGGLFHEKILKIPYLNDQTHKFELFTSVLAFSLFPQLLCTILGSILLLISNFCLSTAVVPIPPLKTLRCSSIMTLRLLAYNKAIQLTSFAAVSMVNSCRVFPTILIALFCSRVADKSLKLGKNKLAVGVIMTIGVVLFNLFAEQSENTNNQPLSWLGIGLLLVTLLCDGFLPDFQAQIKSLYQPSMIDMYFNLNLFTFLLSLLLTTITGQLPYIYNFLLDHPQSLQDLLFYSIFVALGQLVIYRLIKRFKQHIAPLMISTRKCATVVINIIYFHHHVNAIQLGGIALVFAAVMIEVATNYMGNKEEEEGEGEKQGDQGEEKSRKASEQTREDYGLEQIGVEDQIERKNNKGEKSRQNAF